MRRLPTFPVVLAGAAAFLDLYATQPLLPLLARTFRASAFEVGLTVTAPTIAVALFAPFVGRLADSVGLKRVIVGSAVLLAAATLMAATSATLTQLIAWRFVQGVVTPGVFASAVAYIHEVWPPARTGRATAAYVTGTILGGFTGRLVAGLMAADVSWRASFVVLAAISLGLAAGLWIWLPQEPANVHHAHPRRGSVWDLLENRRLVATFGVGFCVLFTQVAMFTYVTFHVAAPPFGLSTVALGWLFVVYLAGAAATALAGHAIDTHGHRVGIGSAMTVAAAGALLTLVSSLPVIILGLALCSTGVFIAQATTSSFIGAVTRKDRALAVGMYSTFYYAGGSAGAALPAAFWSRGGWPACVALVVAVQIVGATIAFTQWTASPATHDVVLPDAGV